MGQVRHEASIRIANRDQSWLPKVNKFRYAALLLLVALAVFANCILHSVASLLLLVMIIAFATMLAGS